MPEFCLEQVVQEVTEELARGDLLQSCVQASTILAEVLKRTGFPDAFPLTVSVTAINGAMAQLVVEHVYANRDLQDIDIKNGAYATRIDMSDPVHGKEWPGHLVVIVPNQYGQRHAMLDVTIEQLNAPEKNLTLHPLNVAVDESFINGTIQHSELIGSNVVSYTAHPDDTTWQDTDGSMRRAGLMVVVAGIVVRLNSSTQIL